jgi:hypothetical protein
MAKVVFGIWGLTLSSLAGGVPYSCDGHGGGGGGAGGAAGTMSEAGSSTSGSGGSSVAGSGAGGNAGANAAGSSAAGASGSPAGASSGGGTEGGGAGGTTGEAGASTTGEAGASTTGEAGASGEAGAAGSASGCAANEYQEVGVSGCRQCTNWRYSELDTSCRDIGAAHDYNPVTHELVVEPGDGMPVPVSWSSSDLRLIDADTFESIDCNASAEFSVRDGLLVADLSQFQACAEASGVATVFELDNIALDYGCIGKGAVALAISFDMTGVTSGPFNVCFDNPDWPRKRLILGSPERAFTGTASPSVCADDEYREVGYAGCRQCGLWQYGQASNWEFPFSCRVIGSHHHFDSVAAEVVIEPGPDLPVPTSWRGDLVQLFNVDPEVTLPPCSAEVTYKVRDGLLIADVSAFQACELPPGTRLDFGLNLIVEYGCAGEAISTTFFSIDLAGGAPAVSSQCFSEDDWPIKAYRGL